MGEREIKYTPMIEQYLDIKENYKDTILFYRVGDFYEMFFDDAHLVAKELELVLTGKDAGVDERVPMCGVPFHSYEPYAQKLIEKGYKVAIVEQVEDPKDAKGIVARGVVKIITPGTIDSGLKDDENNYIGSLFMLKRTYVLGYGDLSTGELYLNSFNKFSLLANELITLHIKELVVSTDFENQELIDFCKQNQILLSRVSPRGIKDSELHLVKNIDPAHYKAIEILLSYYLETKKSEPKHFKEVKNYLATKYLRLDAFTKKNLELCETLRFNSRVGSLLWHLDKCETAMGSRMLHNWLDKPLVDLEQITRRLDFIEAFNNHYLEKVQIKNYLKNVYDLERILGRISAATANAKDLVALRRSLENIPDIKKLLFDLNLPIGFELANDIDEHRSLYELLFKGLVDNPPLTVKEGGMIKPGYSEELDSYKSIQTNSKNWILEYEKNQKDLTGIKTLKVGFNRVTGYYIEVSKGAISSLPSNINYERRATLVNSERFITKELKEYEEIVLHSKDQIENLEYELFVKLRTKAGKYIASLQKLANQLAAIDCHIALSEVAVNCNYVRPTFNSDRKITIVDGRHPVLESVLKNGYIVNDVDINKYNMILITGPNMSGKSTYMRMLAIMAIMAQIGSFVPAKVADLMIFDAIFTRIGAADDLVSGQSTFMVEMLEANYALSNATADSLILFDEIGRGTATYDGMALAQAILEYVHDRIGCVTLFSTHYHELTALESKLKCLKNVHVEAKETTDGVAFLHKVLDGPTDKSYGINVAKLAGLPKSLIARSQMILKTLETENSKNTLNLDLFNFEEYDESEEVVKENKLEKIKERLAEVNLDKMTPIEALSLLYELKEMSE